MSFDLFDSVGVAAGVEDSSLSAFAPFASGVDGVTAVAVDEDVVEVGGDGGGVGVCTVTFITAVWILPAPLDLHATYSSISHLKYHHISSLYSLNYVSFFS